MLKNPFANSSIRYAVTVQNILFGTLGLSIGLLPIMMMLIDPLEFGSFVWVFWALSWLIGLCIISYIQFWWYFSYKTELIYSNKVNQILLRASVYSSLLIYLGVLLQTDQFNPFNILVFMLLITFYTMFIRG